MISFWSILVSSDDMKLSFKTYIYTWRGQMLQSNKAKMYLNYKDNLELEPYLKILNQNDCITLV